jgi:hypothetical protein
LLSISDLLQSPAFWGVAGAFIYASQRWLACLLSSRGLGFAVQCHCTLEFGVALVSGGIAASAFSSMIIQKYDLKDANAIATLVGLLVNPTTPVFVRRVSQLVGSALASKVEEKLPGE